MTDPDLRIEQCDPSPEDRLVKLLWAYDEGLATESHLGDIIPGEPDSGIDADSLERLEEARGVIDLLSLAAPSLAAASSVDLKDQIASRSSSTPATSGHDRMSVHRAAASQEAITKTCLNSGELPRRFGRFEIVQELGRGGFGVVLLADDPVLKRRVALKIPRPEALLTPELWRRFEREAQAAARLTHPNLIAVYEVGQVGTVSYIASAYCDGPNLAEWLAAREKPVRVRVAAKIVAQLADGMEYVHQQGVMHRDLKPSNVLLETRNMAGVESHRVTERDIDLPFIPKITDFGLARIDDLESNQTRVGLLMGTPAYMAPEQASGQTQQFGSATDVYALGAILYELLTGRPVFRGETDLHTLRQVAEDEVTSPRRLRADVPRDLEAICLKSLQKRPQNRYPTAGALMADLSRFLAGEPTEARPVTFPRRLLKWTRRRPALAGLLGGSLAAFVTIAILTAVYVESLQHANRTSEGLRVEAEASAKDATNQALSANQFLYATRMKDAYQWLEHGEIERVSKILEPYDSAGPLAYLRGFEWHHLKRRLHGERLTLTGHRGEVYAVASSPDGRVLVSGAEDGAIKFWNPTDGEELATFTAHTSCVNALAYSFDGQMLASGSCDHTIKLWDASTHQLLATLEGSPDDVQCVAFSPVDGDRLASCGNDPLVRIWDLKTRAVIRTCDTKQMTVRSLAWRPDGKELFYCGGAWDLETNQVNAVGGDAFAIAVSPKSAEVFFGMNDTTIHKMGGNLEQSLILHGHVGRVDSLAFSPHGKWLASGGSRTIRIWDSEHNVCVQTLTGHTGRVQSLAFLPRGTTLASGSFDGSVKLWNYDASDRRAFTTEMCVPYLGLHRELVTISPDFCYVGVLSQYNEAKVLKIADGTVVGSLPLAGITKGLHFLPDGRTLFGLPVHSSKGVEAWDVVQWKSVTTHPLPAGQSQLHGITMVGDRHLATVDATSVNIVDTATGQIWRQFSRSVAISPATPVPQLFSSPDRKTWGVTLRNDEPSWILDPRDQRSTRHAAKDLRAVSNDAQLVATIADPTSVTVINSRSGRELVRLQHTVAIEDVAFSTDAKTIATCCVDGSVYLWNTATGQEITRLRTDGGQGVKVQFSTDGRQLAAVTFSVRTFIPELKYPNGDSLPNTYQGSAHIFVWSGINEP